MGKSVQRTGNRGSGWGKLIVGRRRRRREVPEGILTWESYLAPWLHLNRLLPLPLLATWLPSHSLNLTWLLPHPLHVTWLPSHPLNLTWLLSHLLQATWLLPLPLHLSGLMPLHLNRLLLLPLQAT